MKRFNYEQWHRDVAAIAAGQNPTLDWLVALNTDNPLIQNTCSFGAQLPTITDSLEAIKVLQQHVKQFAGAEDMITEINKWLHRESCGEFEPRAPKIKRQKLNRLGCIYLAMSSAHDKTKIGFSKEPESRLDQLKRHDPHIFLAFVSAPVFTLDCERLFHEKFAEKRVFGEWFNLSAEDRQFIQQHLSK